MHRRTFDGKNLEYQELEEKIRKLESELALTGCERDLSQQEKAEYAAVLSNIPLFILIADPKRRVRKVSNTALILFGAQEEERTKCAPDWIF